MAATKNSGNMVVGSDYDTTDSDPQFEGCVCLSCVESGVLGLKVSDGFRHQLKDVDVVVSSSHNLIHKGLAASTHFDGNTKEKDHQRVDVTYRNWKDLVPDILCIILKPLRLIDNIRFGCVCKNWYFAALNSHSQGVAPQSPFLLLPGDDTGTSDYYQFFDLLHQSFYKIRLPQLRNRRCFGSSEGKLIYMDESAELHVLDPITGSQFDLPSITTLPGVGGPVFDDDGNVTGYFNLNHRVGRDPDILPTYYYINNYFSKVIICSKTSVVAAICKLQGLMAFCLPGDQSWSLIQAEHPDPDELFIHGYQDIVFYNGVLFSITFHSQFGSFHLGDGDNLKTIKFEFLGQYALPTWNLGDVFWYLVEADGDLLLVWRYTRNIQTNEITRDGRCGNITNTIKAEVYKMNWGTIQWEQMTSIGEYALFLGLNCSFSLSTRDFPELKASDIYFTDDHLLNHGLYPYEKRDIVVFNLEDRSIKPCYPCNGDQKLNWPPPIWFTPKSLPQRHSRTKT